jgi:hypothetical protein
MDYNIITGPKGKEYLEKLLMEECKSWISENKKAEEESKPKKRKRRARRKKSDSFLKKAEAEMFQKEQEAKEEIIWGGPTRLGSPAKIVFSSDWFVDGDVIAASEDSVTYRISTNKGPRETLNTGYISGCDYRRLFGGSTWLNVKDCIFDPNHIFHRNMHEGLFWFTGFKLDPYQSHTDNLWNDSLKNNLNKTILSYE